MQILAALGHNIFHEFPWGWPGGGPDVVEINQSRGTHNAEESERTGDHGVNRKPGPLYDRAIKQITKTNLPAFCDWLRVGRETAPEILNSEFLAETRTADLIAKIGPRRILHVEYVRKLEPNLAARITNYRSHIMREHPRMSISQYAVVLGRGRVESCDDPETGFALGLREVYLRDCDPATFLGTPDLAPLAVLAGGDQQTRAQALIDSLRIAEEQPEDRRAAMREAALALAPITLDRSTINQIGRKSPMTTESIAEFYRGTDVGQVIENRGRDEGRIGMLIDLLQDRYGEDPQLPVIAAHLARAHSDISVFDTVTQARTLDQLMKLLAPIAS